MTWSSQSRIFLAVLVGLLTTGLVLFGGTVFRIQARNPGIFFVEAILEGLVTGTLFYLWRRAEAYARIERSRNPRIREYLQLIIFRCGDDPNVLNNVQKILQLLDIGPGRDRNKSRKKFQDAA